MGCRKCKCIRLRGKKCKDRTCDKQCAFGFKLVLRYLVKKILTLQPILLKIKFITLKVTS